MKYRVIAGSVTVKQVREIAETYEATVRTNAEFAARDLQTEALAAIVGAAKCIAYPPEGLDGLIKAAVIDSQERSPRNSESQS